MRLGHAKCPEQTATPRHQVLHISLVFAGMPILHKGACDHGGIARSGDRHQSAEDPTNFDAGEQHEKGHQWVQSYEPALQAWCDQVALDHVKDEKPADDFHDQGRADS